MTDVELLAAQILQARQGGRCLDATSMPVQDEDAYAVQDLLTRHRRDRGERLVGFKLGYTSEAMRVQMGVASPNLGPLTDAMLLENDAVLPTALQPKVEPEIALVLDVDVDGPMSAAECRAAVGEARLALEVVDSIWLDYRFTWAHNTADGSSAAYVVLGPSLDRDDLTRLSVGLERNGVESSRGQGSAAMGDPYNALSWLTHALAGRPRALRRGDVVITGGLCPAVDLLPGDTVTARADGLHVSVRRAPAP